MIYHIRLTLLYTDFLGAKIDLKIKYIGRPHKKHAKLPSIQRVKLTVD